MKSLPSASEFDGIWPNTEITYVIQRVTDQTQLCVYFRFNAAAYQSATAETISMAKADLSAYQNAQAELIAETTAIHLFCSLSNASIQVSSRQPVIEYLQTACNVLQSIISGSTIDYFQESQPQLIQQLPPMDHRSFFRLDVTLQVSMMQDELEVTRLYPLQPHSSDQTGIPSLTGFAQLLEDACNTNTTTKYKLAVDFNNTITWLVNTGGNGFQFTMKNEFSYFALPPLSNQLINSQTAIWNYTSDKTFPPVEDPVLRTYSGIDLEYWMRGALVALSRFFKMYGAAASELNPDLYQLIESHKNTLADHLSMRLTALNDDQHGDLRSARQNLRQQLVLDPAKAYEATTVIQQPMQLDGFANDTAGLYLWFNAQPEESKVNVAASGLALGDQPSFINYIATPSLPGNSTHCSASLKLTPAGITDLSSMFATFVLPFANGISTAINFPVPLRDFPPPPVPGQQFSAPVLEPSTLREARSWSYCLDYHSPSNAQDAVNINLQINGEDNMATIHEPPADLFRQLAQFVEAYPSIQKDFDKYLLHITPDTSDADLLKALNALFAFEYLLKKLAQASIGNDRKISPLLPATLTYRIVESAYDGPLPYPKGALQITITGNTSTYKPQISAPGFTPVSEQDGVFFLRNGNTYLMYSDRQQDPMRTFVLPGLDVLAQNHVTAEIFHDRNRNLSINSAFTSVDPAVKPSGSVVPENSSDQQWDVAKMNGNNGKPAAIEQHLCNLFSELFTNVTGETSMRMEVLYQSPLDPDSPDGITVQTPVLLMPATPFQIPAKWTAATDICAYLSTQIKQWLINAEPTKINASFVFRISLYKSLEDEHALLRLGEVGLGMRKVII